MSLHGAVAHLVAAQSVVRAFGLRRQSSRADVAVFHIGQAIYGSNVHTVAEAERNIRIALRSLEGPVMRGTPELTPARKALRAALRALKGE